MSKSKKTPWWAKLFLSIVGIILTIALIIGALCIFAKAMYDIDVVDTINQLTVLTEQVDEEKNYPNIVSQTEKDALTDSTVTHINSNITNLIVTESGEYTINDIVSDAMTTDLTLTGKQACCLMDILIGEDNATVNFMGQDVSFDLIQISFENITESSADFNVVLKINITSVKEKMTGFPLKYIVNRVPDNLYISSTITITKEEGAFNYSTESKSIRINNLTEEKSESFIKTLNTLAGLGSASELNQSFAGSFAKALIGSEDNVGFAHSLKTLGATDYDFEKIGEENYFIVRN